jgi:hypothetical protein
MTSNTLISEMFVESLILYYKWVAHKCEYELTDEQLKLAINIVLSTLSNEEYEKLNAELEAKNGEFLSPAFQNMANDAMLVALETSE